MAFKAAPLNSTFMVAAILGIIFCVFYIPSYSVTWAFAFGIVFFCMLIASFISMTNGTPDEQLAPIPRKR